MHCVTEFTKVLTEEDIAFYNLHVTFYLRESTKEPYYMLLVLLVRLATRPVVKSSVRKLYGPHGTSIFFASDKLCCQLKRPIVIKCCFFSMS
ncbi:unnamed protein product [Trifolium pratense]|uniref:Uncharacterized protein n=1 Tax=Trifolium pratense TaxID=57577 RepID=A0ACB0LH21_TRIPR|nr:unnamed protein product [Trifolium pratense]